MEKLIISKKLAEEISLNEYNIKDSLYEFRAKHHEELEKLKKENGFRTQQQIVAYLLGGQEKVFEIKPDTYKLSFSELSENDLRVLKQWAEHRGYVKTEEG